MTNPWDVRYDKDEFHYGAGPNDFVRERAGLLPGGRVLCLGSGEGRNVVYLAGRGLQVTGVDGSRRGLEKGRRLAAQVGVEAGWDQADLADYDLGEAKWDGILSIFCHVQPEIRADLHGRIVRALRPRGVLLMEGYRPEQIGRGTGGPPRIEMMVTAGMLRRELMGLEFEFLEETEREVHEGAGHDGLASVVQVVARKP